MFVILRAKMDKLKSVGASSVMTFWISTKLQKARRVDLSVSFSFEFMEMSKLWNISLFCEKADALLEVVSEGVQNWRTELYQVEFQQS